MQCMAAGWRWLEHRELWGMWVLCARTFGLDLVPKPPPPSPDWFPVQGNA